MRMPTLSLNRFTLLLSLYFLLVINIPLLVRLATILLDTEGLKLGLALSMPLLFGALFYLLFSLVTFRYLAKPVAITLLLLSSPVSYAMFYYGIWVDADMIRNFAETNYGEALSYVNAHSLLWWLLTGVLPALLIIRLPLSYFTPIKELLYKGASMLAAVLLIAIILALYFKDYAAIGRNNHYLNKMIIPTHYLYSAGKFVNKTYLNPARPHQLMGLDAEVVDARAVNTRTVIAGVDNAGVDNAGVVNAGVDTAEMGIAAARLPRLLVLVVGETARAMNFELNGYHRPTNEFTRPLHLLSFAHVSSCGTATAVSVPCMFSRLNRAEFNAGVAKTQDNLMDVIQHAKVQTRWLDNDGGCKGVCSRTSNLELRGDSGNEHCSGEYCMDEVLLDSLETEMTSLDKQDTVLVLHLVGSHGPTYYQRYPAAFRRFTPDCARSDIQNCSDREIVNSYDNTLYYDDYVISQIIAQLGQHHKEWQSSLLYISDHGESLGENGLYLHGMPYDFAPEEQTAVPMLLWMSPEFAANGDYDRACLEQQAQGEGYSHDNLFDSVLGLMRIRTQLYRPTQDIFTGCRRGEAVSAQVNRAEGRT